MPDSPTISKRSLTPPGGAIVMAGLALAGFLMLLARPQWFAGDAGVMGIDDGVVRTLGHFSVYGLLAVVLARALGRRLLLAFWICLMLATIEEVHQLFVPYRFGCLSDWLVNFAGITTFLLGYHRVLITRHSATS